MCWLNQFDLAGTSVGNVSQRWNINTLIRCCHDIVRLCQMFPITYAHVEKHPHIPVFQSLKSLKLQFDISCVASTGQSCFQPSGVCLCACTCIWQCPRMLHVKWFAPFRANCYMHSVHHEAKEPVCLHPNMSTGTRRWQGTHTHTLIRVTQAHARSTVILSSCSCRTMDSFFFCSCIACTCLCETVQQTRTHLLICLFGAI